jgi:PAS domain S-box-containing protein
VDALVVESGDTRQVFTLKGQDEGYRLLVEEMEQGTVILDRDGLILYVNRALASLVKKPAEDIVGTSILTWIDPASLDAYQKLIPLPQFHTDLLMRNAIGGAVPVLLAARRVSWNGRPAGIIIVTDLTEHQRQHEIAESEAFMRAVLKQSPQAILVCDPLGSIVMASAGADDLCGPGTVGRNFDDTPDFHPILAGTGVRLTFAMVQANQVPQGSEVIVAPVGVAHNCLVYHGDINDQAGRLLGYVITLADYTERKIIEEKLLRAEQDFKLLWETMESGTVFQDRSGNIFSMNPAAERILGKSPGDFLGNTSVSVEHDTLREDGSPYPGLEHPAMVALRTGEKVLGVVMGVYNPRERDYRWITIDAIPLFRTGEDKPYQVNTIFNDMTPTRQALEALKASEAKISALLKYAPAAIYEIDVPGRRFLSFNDAMCTITGYSREELQALDPAMLLDEDSRRLFTERVRRQLAGEHIGESVEYRIRKKDGSLIYAVVNVAFSSEKPGTAMVVAHDITTRRQMEDALRQSEERFRMALQNAPVSVATQDRNLRFTWAYNQRTRGADEIVGKTDTDLFPQEADRLTALKRAVLETGREMNEQMWVTSNGKRVFLDVFLEPLKDPAGEIIGVGIATVNLTRVRMVEDELRESEERFSKAFHASPVAMVIASLPEGRWVDVNESYLQLTEYGRDEIIGHTSAEIKLINPETRDRILEGLRSGVASKHIDLPIRTKSGKVIHTLSSNTLVTLNGQPHYITSSVDISERKRAEQLKDEFLGLISHEMRTPLTVIEGGLATVLTEGADMSPEDIRLLIQDSYAESLELGDILENLLELTRARANRLNLKLQPTKLSETTARVIKRLAKEHHHRIMTAFTLGTDTVLADPLRLHRILFNLVHNATKFAPPGTEIRLFTQREGDTVTIGVRDHGPGIPEAMRDRLFQPFEQLSLPQNRDQIQGTGLGLVVCRRLVEAHGGKIWFESTAGRGSTFLFTMPVASAE